MIYLSPDDRRLLFRALAFIAFLAVCVWYAGNLTDRMIAEPARTEIVSPFAPEQPDMEQ